MKPSGVSGVYTVSVSATGVSTGTFTQTLWPNRKPELECEIMRRFIASFNASCGKSLFSNPVQNQESDFDFTISTPRGAAYVELMEVAPLEGPYSNAPQTDQPYTFAKTIFDGVMQKSSRYAGATQRDLLLLLYSTHFTFSPCDTALMCLSYWLARTENSFRSIFWYQPLDAEAGVSHIVFPCSPESLVSFDPESVRGNTRIILDPRKFESR